VSAARGGLSGGAASRWPSGTRLPRSSAARPAGELPPAPQHRIERLFFHINMAKAQGVVCILRHHVYCNLCALW
jgi:hypothetical protein